MELKNINVGFALTGSFCTFKKVIPKIKELKDLGANILPIMSYNSYNFNTKFGKAKDFIEEIEGITENKIIHTIQGAEPIGPKSLTDIRSEEHTSELQSLSAISYAVFCLKKRDVFSKMKIDHMAEEH